jgi:hypothetical protein
MNIAARYTWGHTERGYGWQPWEAPQFSIERDSKTGYWIVSEADGSPLCVCVDWNSAQKVAARFRKLERATVTPDAIPDFAYVGEGKTGWVAHTVDIHVDFGETFSSREEAEAYLVGQELRARV